MIDNNGEWQGYKAPEEGSRLPDQAVSGGQGRASDPRFDQIPPYARPERSQPIPNVMQDQGGFSDSRPAQRPAQPAPQPMTGTNAPRPNDVPPTMNHAQGAAAQTRRSNGIAWPIAVVIAVALLCTAIVFSTVSCSSTINGALGSVGFGAPETVEDSSPKIGVISIASSIAYDGSECSPTGLNKLLDKAEADDSIKGVILWVNSGGGTATAGEEMAAAVKEFSKPIVVVSGATNASAAYEISSQADKIFVGKTTAIGSIGVVLQVTDLSGLYEKLGIKVDNITSTDSKDATYGNRPLTEEERAWYQGIVDQINEDFVKTVAEGRDMTIDDVKELANGLTYTGTDAVENGLADEIGYLDDAISYLSEICGYTTPLKAHALYLASSASLTDLISILGKDEVYYGTKLDGTSSVDEDSLPLG